MMRFFDKLESKHLLLFHVAALLVCIIIAIAKGADPLYFFAASIGLWAPIIVLGGYVTFEWWEGRDYRTEDEDREATS